MRVFVLATFTVIAIAASFSATARAAPKTETLYVPPDGPMKFTVQYNGGNCESCEWVLAEGEIDEGATERLKKFVEKEKPPTNIRFNSPGGNLIQALKMGRYLRDSNWDTFVSEDNPRIPGTFDGYKTQKSACYSACVYAFAGGVHRTAADKAVGIHQFYRPDDTARPNDKTITAVDVANMQRLTAVLNEYVRQMGIDQRLVTIASAITPWDPIYLLSSSELKSLNLDNTSPSDQASSGDWRVEPAGDGAIAMTIQGQDGAGRAASLGIMCVQSAPEVIIVELAVVDQTKDWRQAFAKLDLTPQSFDFNLDGKYDTLPPKRLISPVKREGNGVGVTLAITKEELDRMLNAKTAEVAAFVSMVAQSWTGELGGSFSMQGASEVVALALRNCVQNGH